MLPKEIEIEREIEIEIEKEIEIESENFPAAPPPLYHR